MELALASSESAQDILPVARRRPWVALLSVAVGGYVLLTLALLAIGMLLVGVGGDAGIEAFDDSSTRWIADRRVSALNGLSGIFSAWADTWTIIGAAIGAVGVLLPTRSWRRVTVIVVALLVEISAFLSVTYAVGRERPEVEPLSSVPDTGSFPSGHIAAAIVIYGGLALLARSLVRTRWIRVAVLLVGVLVPVAVGWSRWYRGLHHPTDLLGGVLLGIAALAIGFAAARRLPAGDDAVARG